MDIIVSFPFSNGLIRQHYHLLIEMMKLLTVVKLRSLISPVQYCGLMQIVRQFTRHSVHRKWRCGVLLHIHSFWPIFFSIPVNNVYINIYQEFVNQVDNCHVTLLFSTRSDDVLCLARPWVELFQDFLLSWFCHQTISCGISWRTLIKNKLQTFERVWEETLLMK